MNNKTTETHKKVPSNKRTIVSLLFGLVGITTSITLLVATDKLTGAQFNILFLGSTVLALAIYLSPYLEELSIAGNVIKLREAKEEAHKVLDYLKEAQIDIYKSLLLSSQDISGGNGDIREFKDDRIEKFMTILNAINKLNIKEQLQAELKKSLEKILDGQLNVIIYKNASLFTELDKFRKEKTTNSGNFPDIETLQTWNTKSELNTNKQLKGSELLMKELCNKAIDEYNKLLNIYNSLK